MSENSNPEILPPNDTPRKKRLRLPLLLLAAGIILLASAILLPIIFPNSLGTRRRADIAGNWEMSSCTYRFEEDGSGSLILPNKSYPFKYTVTSDQLVIDFESDAVFDSVYTFSLSEDTLVLSGSSGTTGGTYSLTRLK